ncbi:MAG: AAA family ATPase, partial [Planctomycetota bacterium]
ELFVEGDNVIKLGQRRFSVNVQPFDLTTVTRDGEMCLHVTGTGFFEPIADQQLNDNRELWSQQTVSETSDVYRGEYLAYALLQDVLAGKGEVGPHELVRLDADELTALVQRYMGPRYDEAYVKGVHDHDAARLLRALVEMHSTIGMLRFHPSARALASVYWRDFSDADWRTLTNAKLKGFGSVGDVFPDSTTSEQYIADIRGVLTEFVEQTGVFAADLVDSAAAYLFAELTQRDHFAVSRRAADLYDSFQSDLKSAGQGKAFVASLAALQDNRRARYLLARDWAAAFVEQRLASRDAQQDDGDYVDELAALLSAESVDRAQIVEASAARELDGMVGDHGVINDGRYRLNYNRFMAKLGRYHAEAAPRFRRFVERKKEVVDAAQVELRVEEFQPRVLTSFVRNKLIDEVYLPLVGDNLAKQIGVVGEDKRTDLMGLLLLVSPPGYGKTTLMEYIA